MNWNQVLAWVDSGQEIDWNKVQKHQITSLLLNPSTPNLSIIKEQAAPRKTQIGGYIATSWLALDAAEATKEASVLANTHFPRIGTAEAPPIMLDVEGKTLKWQTIFINTWLSHQPHRPISWTNEPFKGAFTPVNLLKKHNVHYFVQLYKGDMSPVDSSAAILDMGRYNFPASLTHPFYDGETPVYYGAKDGCFFTLGRLPS